MHSDHPKRVINDVEVHVGNWGGDYRIVQREDGAWDVALIIDGGYADFEMACDVARYWASQIAAQEQTEVHLC